MRFFVLIAGLCTGFFSPVIAYEKMMAEEHQAATIPDSAPRPTNSHRE